MLEGRTYVTEEMGDKVNVSLQQVMETRKVMKHRRSHIF
jgi:hypothetical protein